MVSGFDPLVPQLSIVPRQSSAKAAVPPTKVAARAVSVFYGDKQALLFVSLYRPEKSVTALIGPSGCGKSTFLRSINRMNDTIPNCRVTGEILIDGQDVNTRDVDPVLLRAQVGMVFQKANPFPKSIFENVAYGVRLHGLAASRTEMQQIVETSLQKAGRWDDVKERLNPPGMSLLGGQQHAHVFARPTAVTHEITRREQTLFASEPHVTGTGARVN